MAERSRNDASRPEHAHELSDAKMKPIIALAVLLIVFSVVAFLVTAFMFEILEEREASLESKPSPLADTTSPPPAPRLQQKPQVELREYRARTRRQLESYQWIDKDGQVLRIPIERAMDLLLQRGIEPVEPQPEETAGSPESMKSRMR